MLTSLQWEKGSSVKASQTAKAPLTDFAGRRAPLHKLVNLLLVSDVSLDTATFGGSKKGHGGNPKGPFRARRCDKSGYGSRIKRKNHAQAVTKLKAIWFYRDTLYCLIAAFGGRNASFDHSFTLLQINMEPTKVHLDNSIGGRRTEHKIQF